MVARCERGEDRGSSVSSRFPCLVWGWQGGDMSTTLGAIFPTSLAVRPPMLRLSTLVPGWLCWYTALLVVLMSMAATTSTSSMASVRAACIPPIPENSSSTASFSAILWKSSSFRKYKSKWKEILTQEILPILIMAETQLLGLLAVERLGHPGPLHGLLKGVALPGLPVVVPVLELLEGHGGPGEPALPL